MKTIASISGKWCVNADMLQYHDHKLLVYTGSCCGAPLEHPLPDYLSFRNVVEDMNRCLSDIYILPERNPSNE